MCHLTSASSVKQAENLLVGLVTRKTSLSLLGKTLGLDVMIKVSGPSETKLCGLKKLVGKDKKSSCESATTTYTFSSLPTDVSESTTATSAIRFHNFQLILQ